MFQAEKTGARLKQLKRQVEEGEEEVARVTAQKRKLQRDVEEQTEQAETTQRELEQLRSKLRTGGSDKARFVRQITCLSVVMQNNDACPVRVPGAVEWARYVSWPQ